jgi:hypothetical protein
VCKKKEAYVLNLDYKVTVITKNTTAKMTEPKSRTFMPFPTNPSGDIAACTVLLITLPMGVMYPNPDTGLWGDCVRTSEWLLLLQGMLVVLQAAFDSAIDAWIEELPDMDIHSAIPELKKVKYLRVWIPIPNAVKVKSILLSLAYLLAGDDEDAEAEEKPNKARKRTKVMSPPKEQILTHRAIRSQAAFLRYYATSRGGAQSASFRSMSFAQPEMVNDDGDVSDDDGEIIDFEESHNANHPCVFLGAKAQFDAIKNTAGLSEDQCKLENYVSGDGFLRFPAVATDNELLHSIKDVTFNGADGLMDFALPSATNAMPKRLLVDKIKTLSAIGNIDVPVDLEEREWKDVRDYLYNIGNEGDANPLDPTIFSPICVSTALALGGSADMCDEGDNYLRVMHFLSMQYRDQMTREFCLIRDARTNDEIAAEVAQAWCAETEKRIINIYSGPPKAGMPQAYALVHQECMFIEETITRDARSGHAVALGALNIVHADVDDGMDRYSSTLARFASITKNNLHMTSPQAAFFIFAFVSSMVTYVPEIKTAQLWFIVLGGSDTGKSAVMNLLSSILPRAAVAREDSQSKMAVTEHGQYGVRFTDEQKFGTKNAGANESVAQLTAISEGLNTHKRLVMPTESSGQPFNDIRVSDQRCFTISASNSTLVAAMASRAVQIYLTGAKQANSRSRSECATLDDKNPQFQAATLAMKMVWAWHFDFWMYLSVVDFYVCKSLYPIFYGICATVYGSSYAPQPRAVKTLGKIAYAIMVNRLTTEFECQKDPTISKFQFLRGNAVILLRDFMLAEVMLTKLTCTKVQDAVVLQTLKNYVIIKATGGAEPVFEMFQTEYIITSLKTNEDVGARTTGFAKSDGVIADVMNRLQMPYGGARDMPAVVACTNKEYTNHLCVAKSAVCQEHIRTPGESAILKFLREEVLPDTDNHWNIGLDEKFVIFKNPVKQRLLSPFNAIVFQDSDALHAPDLAENSLELGMMWLEASGEATYRSLVHPYEIDLDGTTTDSNHLVGSVSVGRGGPLDERRLWGLEYLEETTDAEIDDAFIARKTAELPRAHPGVAVTTPRPLRTKTGWRVPGAMQIKTDLFIDVLDKLTAAKLNTTSSTANPIEQQALSNQHSKDQALWNLCAGISGEFDIGAVVFNGVDSRGSASYDTVTIGPCRGSVELINPLRQEQQPGELNMEATDDVTEHLLPRHKSKVKFRAVNGTVAADTLEMVARKNMA